MAICDSYVIIDLSVCFLLFVGQTEDMTGYKRAHTMSSEREKGTYTRPVSGG